MYSNEVNGIKYIITNQHDHIQRTILKSKQWNDNIFKIILNYIKTRNLTHFVNIGSHIGTVCLPISLNIDKVSAVEAYPPTYTHLCTNK